MRVLILVAFCLSVNFVCSWAWQVPERCQQSSRRRRYTAETKGNTTIVPVIEASNEKNNHRKVRSVISVDTFVEDDFDILKLVEKQENQLKTEYKDYEFASIPVSGNRFNVDWVELYSAYNCAFKTHKARSLYTVLCHGKLTCDLVYSVSTVDTYTASEGYNWGAKVSTKYVIVPAIFEVGGEVSLGGTYSCTYNKGKTTTVTVKCSAGEGKTGIIQLYVVKSDMECDIGRVKMVKDMRNNKFQDGASVGIGKDFEYEDMVVIEKNAVLAIRPPPSEFYIRSFMIDENEMPARILKKIKKFFPLFNATTDTFSFADSITWILHGRDNNRVQVQYYKKESAEKDRRITIPFSNENGDSVFQYACIHSPHS